MKLSLLCTASIFLGASLTLASAQGRPGGRGPGGPPPGGKGGPDGKSPSAAEIATHVSERFAAIAAFDADKNGKLDSIETAAVAKAIDDGSLQAGPPPGAPGKGKGKPDGAHPPGDVVAVHVAKLYESLAAYDADKNGSLDATEQAAVAKAIEDGSLKLPRPGGPGGPPGGRPGRPDRE